MPTITVRLFHHPTRTPIAELQGVDPGATLSSLRAMAERHLAAEEACMMRVFARWHIEVQLGARKAVVELTAQDEAASLSSLGIEDYSSVLLEGPLTGDFEGVGQAVALVDQRLRENNTRVDGVLLHLSQGISSIMTVVRQLSSIISLPDDENVARLVLVASEQRALERLLMLRGADKTCRVVFGEEETARKQLPEEAKCSLDLVYLFAIDTATPHPSVKFEGAHTAVKSADGGVTLRSSQPLSETRNICRWAIKIHEAKSGIMLGLLPKLPADKIAKMGGGHVHIGNLGGWGIYQDDNNSYVRGDWQCEKFPFRKGDLVSFEFSFSDRTLTIRCGDRKTIGHIPKIKENAELYPAFTFYAKGEKISFEKPT